MLAFRGAFEHRVKQSFALLEKPSVRASGSHWSSACCIRQKVFHKPTQILQQPRAGRIVEWYAYLMEERVVL
jgi:hypothetical protein